MAADTSWEARAESSVRRSVSATGRAASESPSECRAARLTKCTRPSTVTAQTTFWSALARATKSSSAVNCGELCQPEEPACASAIDSTPEPAYPRGRSRPMNGLRRPLKYLTCELDVNNHFC